MLSITRERDKVNMYLLYRLKNPYHFKSADARSSGEAEMSVTAGTRIYLSIIAVLLLVIVAMAYKFIVAGSTEKAADGRVAIILEPGEKALMLREMRGFLSGLQGVMDALSREDMQAVAKASRALGAAHAGGVPAEMLGKLPLEFKTLALGVHSDFDTIAMDAEWTNLPKRTLGQVSDVLKKCTACHDSYRVTTEILK